MSRWLVAATAVALAVGAAAQSGCVVQRLLGHKLTGTCDGACEHYMDCKPGHTDEDRSRCKVECPGVFSDQDSLMEYESMTCRNAVEYIDGTPKTSLLESRT